MALVNRSFQLDITPGAIPKIVNVSEYDENRQFTVNLIDEGGVFEIPSGTTAKVEGTIGGSGFSANATISGNTITFTLSESMTAKAGDVWCKIKLTKDSKPIQTAAFILRCDRAGLEADTVVTNPGFGEQIAEAVGDYLDEHNIVIDDTLSVEGAAADAEKVGELKSALSDITDVSEIEEWEAGKYYSSAVSVTYIDPTNPSGASAAYACAYLQCQPGEVFYVEAHGSSGARPYVFLSDDSTENVIERCPSTSLTLQKIVAPEGAAYVVFNHNVNYSHKVYVGEFVQDRLERAMDNVDEAVKERLGVVGRFSGAFSSASQQLDTGIALTAGKKYFIRVLNTLPEAITLYCYGDTSNYKRVSAYINTSSFTPVVNGNLIAFNYNGSLFDVDLLVTEFDSISSRIQTTPNIYVVSKSSRYADFDSVTEAFLNLKDDKASKIIYIEGGDYDIYQEYNDAGIPAYTGDNPSQDFWEYCVVVPENTHVIGRGLVRLLWMPTIADGVTQNQATTVSPLNVAGNCIIENVEVHCKNGRYCLHDDPLGQDRYSDARKIFKNVKFYKYHREESGYGYANTIGIEFAKKNYYEFDNCLFNNESTGYAFYGHSRQTVGGSTMTKPLSSNVVVKDCVINAAGSTAVKLGNSGSSTNLQIRVDVTNCYISGDVDIVNESSASTPQPNAFDLTLNRCSDVTVTVQDPDNQYPPKIFA